MRPFVCPCILLLDRHKRFLTPRIPKMIKAFAVFFVKLLLFTAAIMGIHYYIYANFFSDINLHFPLWSVYGFNAVMVAGVYAFISYRVSQGSKNAFNLFLSLTVVKMVLVLIFLLPVFAGKTENTIPEVSNFFVAYFLLLSFEVLSLNNFFKKL